MKKRTEAPPLAQAIAIEDKMNGCTKCEWYRKRPQRCATCKRNDNMKDNFKEKVVVMYCDESFCINITDNVYVCCADCQKVGTPECLAPCYMVGNADKCVHRRKEDGNSSETG